jgi:sortase A
MKRIINYIIMLLLITLGSILIFNTQITNWVIDFLSNRAYQTRITSSNQNSATFNYKAVRPVSSYSVAIQALNPHSDGAIAKINIPAVNIKLPIFYGLSNKNLVRGVGTMKRHQKLGRGNYAIAGHYMTSSGVLFSPLANVHFGEKIYLINRHYQYIYRITGKSIIHNYQIGVIKNIPHQKIVTLITCASAKTGEKNRIMVRGKLIDTVKNSNN